MTTIEEAHEAVRTLLGYIEGDESVDREGLKDTPHRVIESWSEIFAGYNMDASELASHVQCRGVRRHRPSARHRIHVNLRASSATAAGRTSPTYP